MYVITLITSQCSHCVAWPMYSLVVKLSNVLSHACRIPANASNFVVEDWDTGEEVRLTLDATKTPVEHAEGLYKRARKLRRAADAVQPLLEAAKEEQDYLEQARGWQ